MVKTVKTIKRLISSTAIAVAALALLGAGAPGAAHAGETACAKVSLEITQELTLERVAFDAKLVLTNNLPSSSLDKIRVDVTLKDKDGNIKTEKFFIKLTSADGITTTSEDKMDGTGSVAAGGKAEVHWLIIPSPETGGESKTGTDYFAGATLTYSLEGKEDIISIHPDKITVLPMPRIMLDYFAPYQVLGDNPMTLFVKEPPVPYELAVRVLNYGFGPAYKLKIESGQPVITANESELLTSFQILGSSVNDAPVSTSLTLDMGDVLEKSVSAGYWLMATEISGKFERFDASVSHTSELGGELTSFIRPEDVNTHYLIHRVKVNRPGRDNALDFLAERGKDPLDIAIFESEIPGGTGLSEDAVSEVTNVSGEPNIIFPPRPEGGNATITLTITPAQAMPAEWIYMSLLDPSLGTLTVRSITRQDGSAIDPSNFWIDKTLDEEFKTEYLLRFVDYRATGNEPTVYDIEYNEPVADGIAPVTTLFFDGPHVGPLTEGGPVYITKDTRIIFFATDLPEGGGGVREMENRFVTDPESDFEAAHPIYITGADGPYTIEYKSTDMSLNVETAKRTDLMVDNTAPSNIVFTAPDNITPYAPAGVVATRTADFKVTATDTLGAIEAQIDIFNDAGVLVATLTGSGATEVAMTMSWDGKDSGGDYVPTGVTYTVLLTVSDGMNAAPVEDRFVSVDDWFDEKPVDLNIEPANGADQMYPDVYSDGTTTTVVWQDFRNNNNWDVFMKTVPDGTSTPLTGDGDQTRPAIFGNIVVWQDNADGDWDIYGYDLSKAPEFALFPIATGLGDQTNPAVSGKWVVWQDKSSGNWDIYAWDMTTTVDDIIQVTTHTRDQIRPSVDGSIVVWEDYSPGPPSVYEYDLDTPAADIENYLKPVPRTSTASGQTVPDISGTVLVWTDDRDGDKKIYWGDASRSEMRATYGEGDHTDAVVYGDLMVYTDFESGLGDPNLSFMDLGSGVGGRLSSNPALQGEAAITDGTVVWHDTRHGFYQIYYADVAVEPLDVTVDIRPGMNLIAVGKTLADKYDSVADFVNSGEGGIVISRALDFNGADGTYSEDTGATINLTVGMGLVVYAENSGTIKVAGSGEVPELGYNLEAGPETAEPGVYAVGTNVIGILSVPAGYNAYDLMDSVGLDNIQSVRRFNNWTGSWETVSTRPAATEEGFEKVGPNFTIRSGDGLIITMKKTVNFWSP